MQTTATPAPAFAIGDRVIVFSFDTFVDDRMVGTVVALPRPNGLLRDDMIAVDVDSEPTPRVVHVDPRRVAPVSTCDTCRYGCLCEIRDPNAGCGHYGCWGPRQTHDCPGFAAERARIAAARHVRAFTIGAVR